MCRSAWWRGASSAVDDHKIVQRNIALQREWYGEPLGDRVRRLVVAFDVSQAYLAEVLGISAPMLSQVMSGRRAKIGNPVVLARLIMLERKVLTPEVAAGSKEAIRAALEDVKASRPTVNRDNFPVGVGPDGRRAADCGSPGEPARSGGRLDATSCDRRSARRREGPAGVDPARLFTAVTPSAAISALREELGRYLRTRPVVHEVPSGTSRSASTVWTPGPGHPG